MCAPTRLCFVASFEDVYRTGQIRRFSMLAEASSSTDLASLTAAVPAYVIDDIDQQQPAMLDYDNQFRIDQVGLYLSRQGGLVTWSAEDFLQRLGTTTTLPSCARTSATSSGPRSNATDSVR